MTLLQRELQYESMKKVNNTTPRYMKGDGIAQCLMGAETSVFEALTPTPTCSPKSELLEKCSVLTAPTNGDVVYETDSSAYFTCNAGYTLIGAEPVSGQWCYG